jgi:alpha,alpha-trehalase
VNCSEPPKFELISRRFDAVIFDLDGVITDTASLHAAAWKEMFDKVLEEISDPAGGRQAPFDKKEDYLRYVDGKPRRDGVIDFLASRKIELPEGQPDDAPDKLTVFGLGNSKNHLFQQKLKEDGANVYDTSMRLIRDLRAHNIRTAVVSSSKNCRGILERAGISDLFDAIVDGRDAAEQNLDGKPAPDIFLTAARLLGVRPERAAVVEDALAGVQAGRLGHFACVIGVDRNDQSAELEKHGADVVVTDLCEIGIDEQPAVEGAEKDLPSALQRINDIYGRLAGRTLAVFLDYDGTLTPIVRRPEDAELSKNMRQIIGKLAAHCPVAIVSGRDLKDVRERVGLEQLYYAGSHGFDIAGSIPRAAGCCRKSIAPKKPSKNGWLPLTAAGLNARSLPSLFTIVKWPQRMCPRSNRSSGRFTRKDPAYGCPAAKKYSNCSRMWNGTKAGRFAGFWKMPLIWGAAL